MPYAGQFGGPPQGQFGGPPQGQFGGPPQGQFGGGQGQFGQLPVVVTLCTYPKSDCTVSTHITLILLLVETFHCSLLT